jgi:hypothetical protein
MNQSPFLIIKWPQLLHSRVRSTFRSRAESDIALLPRQAGAQVCLSAIGAGTFLPMMPTTLLLNVALCDGHLEASLLSPLEDSHKVAGGWA